MATNHFGDSMHYPASHCAPRHPPSPPMDSAEPRISLPPISDLIGLADAGSPTFDSMSPRPRRSSFPAPRPQTSPYSPLSAHTAGMPPTPPVGAECLCDHQQHHAASGAGYRHESTPPLEDPARAHRISLPPTYNGSYYQRPLPTAFPPMVPPPASAWHGHYMSPAPTFQQSQDRYICPTCNKAFSRPSSLRIHNYSHTGEKPFKCPVNGCGKAFSVRSNMKRHERGCHTDGMPGGVYAAFSRSP